MNKFLTFLFLLVGVFAITSAAPSKEVQRLTKLLNEAEPEDEPEHDLKTAEQFFGGFPGGFGGGYGGYGGGYGGYGGGYGGYGGGYGGYGGGYGGWGGGFGGWGGRRGYGSFSGSWGG